MTTSISEDNEISVFGNEVQRASVLQGVHTVRTAVLNYAQTSKAGNITLNSESNRIKLFRLASQEWHADIGLRAYSKGVEREQF